MQCPKCQFDHAAQTTECLKCGIVFAKYHHYQDALHTFPIHSDAEQGTPVTLQEARTELLYRLLALKLSRYEKATPETLWRDFLDATGTLHIDDTGVTCALNLRSHHPALIDAGFADLQTPIPWWDGRTLRFRFPPR